MKKVTMRDIGRAAGVSAVTVSKALAGKTGMSDDMRRRIQEIAAEMGYQHPEGNAVRMKSGLDIGILVSEEYFQPDSFYSMMYRKLVARLSKDGHYGLLELVDQTAAEELRLPHLLESRHVDGLILLGQPRKEYFRKISSVGTPLVFLDFYDEQGYADSVVGDNAYGCYRLTSHLIKNGHREIGFVGNYHATGSIMDRYLGYLRALLLHGLDVHPEWILDDRDDRNQLTDIRLPEKLPGAFVCNCDVTAVRLISALEARGMSVPEDISVTGFDDYLMQPSPIPLSTFRVDSDGMVELAVKAIVERCSGSRKPFGRLIVGGRPVYRQSEIPLNLKEQE